MCMRFTNSPAFHVQFGELHKRLRLGATVTEIQSASVITPLLASLDPSATTRCPHLWLLFFATWECLFLAVAAVQLRVAARVLSVNRCCSDHSDQSCHGLDHLCL